MPIPSKPVSQCLFPVDILRTNVLCAVISLSLYNFNQSLVPKSISPGAPQPLMASTSKVLHEYIPRRPVDLSHTSASSGYTDTEALTYADLNAGPAPSDSEVISVSFQFATITFAWRPKSRAFTNLSSPVEGDGEDWIRKKRGWEGYERQRKRR